MNSVSEMGLGLANFAVFAKLANWLRISLRLRSDCELVAKIPALLFLLLLILSLFLHRFLGLLMAETLIPTS